MLPRALLTGVLLITVFACHSPSEENSSYLTTGELPAQSFDFSETANSQSAEAANWRTAGGAYADRQRPGHLEPTDGQGVLVNLPDDQRQSDLITSWEHEDLDLSLDFMLPKGAHSRLFLQGRYAVELVDSWGKDSVVADGCGGIAQQAPRLNACRAPGLWQHLGIKFRAPRFDENGQKTTNAQFTEVTLNGSVIHQDVAVDVPSPDAPFGDEKGQGPLVISGSGNPLALKNINYKSYGNDRIQLQDLRYQLYAGTYDDPAALEAAEPLKQGPIDSLSHSLKEDQEKFALVFEGSMQVPSDGEYLFTLRTAGPSWLYVDGEEATTNQRAEYMDQPGYYHATLKAGAHPFRLVYTKSVLKWVNGLSLVAEGPQLRQQALQAQGSSSPAQQTTPILVDAEEQPVLQRGFFYHEDQKKTHCVLVGLPTKMNYAVDLRTGTLLSAWDGDFVDVTQMWHERGEPQTAQPRGNVLELSAKPAFARLSDRTAVWPDSVSFDDPYLQTQGYTLDATGAPVFHYQLGDASVDEHFYPGSGERSLVRKVSCTFGDAGAGLVYCLLGEGERVEVLPDGSYGIDDKRYYLSVDTKNAAVRKRSDQGKEQLLATLTPQAGKATLQYTIVW
ncbi:MAG: family 16 glycoside hydrolase [Tunicatimonas sp.]